MNMLEAMPELVESRETPEPSRPLRVVLASSSSGSRGGGELYLAELAGGLKALGHQVASVMSDHPRMDELESLLSKHGPVHRVRYQNTYDRRLRSIGAVMARGEIRRIAGELAKLQPDVIHVNKQNLEDGLDLLVSAKQTKLPVVATVHVTRTMTGLRSVGGTVRDWVSRSVLRSIPCPLIAIARSGLADLSGLAIDKSRLNLVWNGVSERPPSDREAVRLARGTAIPAKSFSAALLASSPKKIPCFFPRFWHSYRPTFGSCGSETARFATRWSKRRDRRESRTV